MPCELNWFHRIHSCIIMWFLRLCFLVLRPARVPCKLNAYVHSQNVQTATETLRRMLNTQNVTVTAQKAYLIIRVWTQLRRIFRSFFFILCPICFSRCRHCRHWKNNERRQRMCPKSSQPAIHPSSSSFASTKMNFVCENFVNTRKIQPIG